VKKSTKEAYLAKDVYRDSPHWLFEKGQWDTESQDSEELWNIWAAELSRKHEV
jgi:hypothetical protein